MLCNIYGRLVTLISFVFVLYVFLNNHITCFYLIDKQSSVSTDNSMNYSTLYIFMGARGGAVVEVLRYKPEGRKFNSRWCHWKCRQTPTTHIISTTEPLYII